MPPDRPTFRGHVTGGLQWLRSRGGGAASSIPARLSGWLLAGAASLIAIVVLWPAPASDPLRMPLIRACTLLARRMRAEVGHVRGGAGIGQAAVDAQVAESAAAIRSLRALCPAGR
jgi:hypothetical protein